MKTTFITLALLTVLLLSARFSPANDSVPQDGSTTEPAKTAAESTKVAPQAGPENGGMRLRLLVTPRDNSNKEKSDTKATEPAKSDNAKSDNNDVGKQGYDVRIDLMNVSTNDIKLRAAWMYDNVTGDLNDYLDAATSIETEPAIAPWIGGVNAGHRTAPQAEQVLKAGETLSVKWQTTGKHLKNRVTNPQEVQNPEFPTPGLYSVHAKLVVPLQEGSVLLRSNEALVPVGNSGELPKASYGQLWSVTDEGKTGTLNLGTLNKVAVGDQFTHISKTGSWKLTITDVFPGYSVGLIEPTPFPGAPIRPAIQPPQRGDSVSLMLKD